VKIGLQRDDTALNEDIPLICFANDDRQGIEFTFHAAKKTPSSRLVPEAGQMVRLGFKL